jgi:hypothetical protein
MRFASEQIMLANDEYRLRVESIMTAIDEERTYYYDIIKNKIKKYKDQEKQISDEYQARLYHDSYVLTDATEKSYRKALEKQIVKNKSFYDEKISEIEASINNDTIISDAKRRLRELDAHFEVALNDAKTIKDETIKEMNDLYQEANAKYSSLKPYLENKVNALDPTFYKSLESMKKRHQYKMKVAEIELEEATKGLLKDYLKVFYEDKPQINQELYLSQIEQLEDERKLIREESAKKFQKSDLVYHQKINALDKEDQQIKSKIETLRNSILQKDEKIINSIKMELDTLESRFNNVIDKQGLSFQNEISQLTNEYNESYTANQKYYANLSQAFNKILDSYYPYLKVAKNNKVIKQVVRENEKRMKQKKNREFKKLNKQAKLADYLEEQK